MSWHLYALVEMVLCCPYAFLLTSIVGGSKNVNMTIGGHKNERDHQEDRGRAAEGNRI